MMEKRSQSNAEALLRPAHDALAANKRKEALEFARRAVKLDPNLEEGWIILAALGDPLESVTCLKRALEINPASKKAREGMRWAVKRLKEAQQSEIKEPAGKKANEKPADRNHRKERSWGFSLFFTVLVIGFALMVWIGMPALDAQASALIEPREKNVLVKPTLTPTITPTPTPTQTPTPTLTPTALPTADTSYAAYFYHSWDIPEEVSGTNDFWIEVDLSAQMLYAYRGDQILNSFFVSTGTSKYPTVTGAYKIYSMHPSYTMIGPGYNLPDVPYAMFFHKGYSIHGTYWHSNFGTPMSHGCVNMYTNDAEWVYNQASVGTYVFVHY